MNIVGLDFETYAKVNLPVEGTKNYTQCEHFMVLLAAVARQSPDVENGIETLVIDFTKDYEVAKNTLEELLEGQFIAAHNAVFEAMVLERLGIEIPYTKFVDSAVFARVSGLGSSLEAAAPQGLGLDKLPSGKEGIQLFCIPGTYQMESGSDAFNPKVIEDHPDEWAKFMEYCALDAALSLQLVNALAPMLDDDEATNSSLTLEMNLEGWRVDLPLVKEMHRRYLANVDREVAEFRSLTGAKDLNLSSTPQLIKWCKERGINAKSFDEQHVESMIDRIERKIDTMGEDEDDRLIQYREVLLLLRTKQTLGGSSLKKLKTLLDQVHVDGKGRARLYDSYKHAGAGTTLRASGGMMMTLPRMGGEPRHMEDLYDPTVHWTNSELAENLRQVFTASHRDGLLIVGDYKAVESRGLAWYAGEEWKLEAYREGRDVYSEQAAKFEGKTIDQITKGDRQFGKFGELSCGYQAGPEAVQSFTAKMGHHLTHGEAKKLVNDFRSINPETVKFWYALQAALDEALDVGMSHIAIPHGSISFATGPAIGSLQKQEPGKGLKSMLVRVSVPTSSELFTFTRVFHGLYREGNSIYYWKPSARKTGDLWVPEYTDPKTGQRRKYSLYGGKLAGILTQSLCRQIFMEGLMSMALWTMNQGNTRMVGQFHDEMVVDWVPQISVIDPTAEETVTTMTRVMSTTSLPGFPLACDVKYDYRYTK